MRFAAIETYQHEFPITMLCRVLSVSCSGYYDFIQRKQRPPTPKELEDKRVDFEIRVAFAESKKTYGRPRIFHVLRRKGMRIGHNRIRRKMAKMGLYAKKRRRFKKTTDSDHEDPIAPNLVAQNFNVSAPNRVWCSDLTDIRTWEGWVYLAVVIDLYSRKVVGWAAADHMRAELIGDAIKMANGRRDIKPGLIFHSDRGCQYTSKEFRDILAAHQMKQSMSRAGDCYDNSVVESFNDKIKTELIYPGVWETNAQTHLAIAQYLELFYNPKRLHSTIDYMSPNEFEDINAVGNAA